eukprot:TRINITY_DN22773_c0_g1_i1.p1 TRINITY_DN22773_c0_g1~~TRINITY_DN22773_c0_g1_i1.p1  ORF type:complete len:215 (+),score=71.67 TRINITY_DN22773_c0_g1_i1:54-647(+)
MSMSNIGKFLGVYAMVQVVDFTDESNVMLVRNTYFIVQSLCWVVMLGMFFKIKMAANKTVVQAVKSPGLGQDPSTEPTPYSTTVEEYHLGELWALMGKLALSTVIVNLLFMKWRLIPPLCMQCLLNPQQVYDCNLFAIHISGKDEKELPIPWEQKNPMDFSKMLGKESKHVKKSQEKALKEMRAANVKAIKADKKAQ